LGGKLEPYIKSEPIPVPNDDDVKVVVAKNYEQIVNDPTKDVLLEAYAPWCGHCKKLEPIFSELAKKLKSHDSLVIAKIDATANDLPPDLGVKGFPTIFFFPANNKQNPIKHEGAREVKDFIKFLKKHVTVPLKDDENAKDEL